jgi:glycosyltransferase involved in cell wall biosynthesis
MDKNKKIAVVTTHPIQYYAPLFKMLQQRGNLKVKVFYTWSQSGKGAKFDPGFGKKIEWDIPLLEGYEYTFVNNISKKPGTHHFNGVINPTLNNEIEEWDPGSILVIGWSFNSHLKCMRHFHGKVPIIFRGDSTLLAEQWGPRLIIRTLFLKWVYRYIDFALYVGTNNKMYFLRHGVKDNRLVFAPHAIDNERFFEEGNNFEEKASSWRKELGIMDQDMVFLYAGKLEYKKDPALLIKAFMKLKNPAVHLVIIGNGPLEKKLKFNYSRVRNLHFIDFQNQSQMPVVYRLGDILVLPSKGPIETWGLSVNEAMACSRAIIVSDRCGCGVDLVKPNVNGYIFRRTNLRDLMKKMNLAVENKQRLEQMGRNSLEIIKSWSFEKICSQLEDLVLTRIYPSQEQVPGSVKQKVK